MFGFYRLAAAVPRLHVADVRFNTKEVIGLIRRGIENQAAVILFPELTLTGYTCGDLFFQSRLLDESENAFREIAAACAGTKTVVVVGAPVRFKGRVFNAAVVLQNGAVRGIVPKSFLPNYREFYEKRHFSSGWNISGACADFAGAAVPFGTDLLFEAGREMVIGIELCEDLWSVIPPSCRQVLAGATLILNPSASNELVGKAAYRRSLVSQQSARGVCAYAYASSGCGESTTDMVFGGHCLIAENGTILLDSPRFSAGSALYFADADLARITGTRYAESSFRDNAEKEPASARTVALEAVEGPDELTREYSRHPFVPEGKSEMESRCDEIISIQAWGLAKRLRHIGCRTAVIGVSGGLDSTLALLVTVRAMTLAGKSAADVVAVTMPGFGTTSRTLRNACRLCRELGVTLLKIDITEACMEHFRAIGHDPEERDVVYENTQARERTQILMDVANQRAGIVVGTGDLSEIAMGYCTYNADHMSMYAVNSGVPKTLVRHLINWLSGRFSPAVKEVLDDISATPVSPELLPAAADGTIVQKTEEILAPYEVLDFFLYHFVKYGAPPEKLLFLACRTFPEYPKEQLEQFLRKFIKRFFSQQFKRSCIPDGPKVGSISLSPRADWRMPSDAVPWM